MERSKIKSIYNLKPPIVEAFKTLRSNILFSSLDRNIQTIIVTSANSGEGKTTIASNIAIVMAQTGKKTIIIDCDLRKPCIHRFFGISNQSGLSSLLIDEVCLEDIIKDTKEESLKVIPAGIRPPNPSELLSSSKMKDFIEAIKENYDCIIIDTPPITIVTDAQILAQYGDGCLLVAAGNETRRNSILMAVELLEKVNAKILGVILNKMKTTKRKRYYGRYYVDEKDNKKANE